MLETNHGVQTSERAILRIVSEDGLNGRLEGRKSWKYGCSRGNTRLQVDS